METLKRKQEIMLLNTLLCLLVIFIHVASHPVSNYIRPSLAYTITFIPWRLSAFVVQGFIFLSAVKIFLKPQTNFKYGSFMIKKIKAIYIPYIVMVLVYYFYFISNGYFPFSIKDIVFYIVSGSLVSPFYFIVAIMQFYLLMPLWIKMTEKIKPYTAIIISFLIMLVAKHYIPQFLSGFEKIASYNDRIFTTYLIYWVCGCYVGKHYEKLLSILKKLCPFFAIAFIIMAVSDIYFSYNSFVYNKYFAFLENLHMVYCIFAIAFLFSLFIYLRNINIPFLKYIDAVSYEAYLLHCLIIFITNEFMNKFGISSITTQFIIRFVAAYFITFSICITFNNIKLKAKFL